ncbi:hypothetical protein VE01_09218 [Pseudogymnoascus verrucosus]|uniref:ubiquitinyl hydrolase 1 n=1 Tax=Pseudogymnoascus verrucosus TaxID=342668 RepID=A0A1B8GBJ9_9PEZI|nr:uncharacterized protein VE01_09218 [Pseudogymnoascus verrucosus]OBT93157.1 hypothetical protein VE01_09218 [Pseudogymnoascus verrucosus]
MFQPQAIPFSSLAYAASVSGNSLPSDYNFQAATLNLGLNFTDLGSFGSQIQRYNSTLDNPPTADDMATLEAPARGYQPDLKGPLVGGEKSTHDIRDEHAKADPGYMAKASQLCQTYSHYRPLLDDANCRWRSMNFPYLGTFHNLGSKDRIDEEYGSMNLTGSIEMWCDHRKWIFEDIRGEVINLLTDLAAIHVGPQSDANSLILRRFNDEEVSSAIMYYFRLFASAFLKAISVTNQGFIPDGVGNFCKDMLEPLNIEVENLGVTILIDVLMNPMSIAVEIVYQDRSGTHVNSHLIRAEDDNGIPINPAGPTVHFLYQPGHYDILCKYTNASQSLRQHQIIDSASAASNIRFNRGGVFNRAMDPSPIPNLNSFYLPGTVNIPGLSLAALSNHGFPSTYTPLGDYEPILTPTYPFDTSVSTPNMQYVPPISAVSPHDSGTPIVPAAAPSVHSAPSQPQRTRNLHVEVPLSSLGNQFRHSKYEYESDWNDPSAPIFQTSMFKNSHYNTAHYSNPNFQPEEWSPDDEETSHASRRFDESQVDVHVTLK